MDSLYLDLQDKNVLVVGSGEVGQRRAQRFLSSGANVIIISRHTSDELKMGALYKSRKELKKWVEWADLMVVASSDSQLNQKATFI